MSTLESLPRVTKLNGLLNQNLRGQLVNSKTGQYDYIAANVSGKEYVLFSRKNPAAIADINPYQENAILTTLYAALSGKGVETEGAMLWCYHHADILETALNHVDIKAIPAKKAGIEGYEGNMSLLIRAAAARGEFIAQSLTRHGVKETEDKKVKEKVVKSYTTI
jgi:hypothetical protein